MLFNSLEFLIFFPIVTALYFLLPHRFRWFMLLTASCIFYMFFIPAYILILIFTIIIDYIAGIMIEEAKEKKKLFLICSLVANIGVLAIFKYYNFLAFNLDEVAHAIGWNYSIPLLGIILPIGLSFHTFQAMSYTIEVYRGNQKAERHFGIYSLYVMYYPQLVAGPIERPQNVLEQFKQVHHFDGQRVANGLKLMLWGMFKKVVIADRLALYVNEVYDHPDLYHGFPVILATVFFAFQIYCDFSGYSDIALGASEVMGIRLMKNFDRPYAAKTISEFWKRWHISLSTWFKDYLYIPLGGNRVGKGRHFFNLFFTFLVSGLWHGASWNFVLWGALHGFFLVFAQLSLPIRERINRGLGLTKSPFILNAIQVGTTFFLVCFAWIFFRAVSFNDAVTIIKNSVNWSGKFQYKVPGFGLEQLLISLGLILFMEFIHRQEREKPLPDPINNKPILIRWGFYHAMVLAIIFLGIYSRQQFIYFQF